MCKWWVAGLGVLILAGSVRAGEMRQAQIPAGLARLEPDQEIVLIVEPHRGDAWTRLALRMTGDADRWRELARLNGQGESLQAGRRVRIPLPLLRESLQIEVVRALFPEDHPIPGGWTHRVVAGSSVEGESLWKIAEWFTGDGANYPRIRDANPGLTLSTRRGAWITIPSEVLMRPYRAAESKVRIAEDDPVSAETTKPVTLVSEIAAPSSGAIHLDYEREGGRPYATYRLQQGEALYSSVAIRFTGRVYAQDVHEVVEQIVEFNGIRDVSKLPVNYPVRIPMELLTAEWRPSDDPKRLAREHAIREGAKLAQQMRGSASLAGVHIILDAGHGGRDVGTEHDGVFESTYVYDVACRLKKILESKTEAHVSMTTRSRSREYRIPDRDVLEPMKDHEVLTTPRYDLADPVVGVNLRWYLANSVFRKAMSDAEDSGRVIFISIHADSLHPSLRGAMAYIPGERHVRGTYTKTGDVYLARAEVRESPSVTQSDEEALMAEGVSMRLAESIISTFRSEGLKVHPYNPVRDNVVRNGREWVPAIIRYNKIPARLLLEICNLGNPDDRKLMQTKVYRQKVAESIHEGIISFVRDQRPESGAGGVRTAAR